MVADNLVSTDTYFLTRDRHLLFNPRRRRKNASVFTALEILDVVDGTVVFTDGIRQFDPVPDPWMFIGEKETDFGVVIRHRGERAQSLAN